MQHERSRRVIDLPRCQQAHHVDQTELDGVRVLEDRERDLPPLPLDVGVNYQPFLPPLFVEITEFLTTQGWGGTPPSVILNMLTASDSLGI
jgi:hypothetical protein